MKVGDVEAPDRRALRHVAGIAADPLVAATLSPFATGAIDVRLTTLFAHDKTAGSYIRSLFFIDPAGLTFAVGPDAPFRVRYSNR